MVLPVVMSGTVSQLGLSSVVGVGSVRGEAASSATLRARSTACLSGEDCVGVCREPCKVKVGDTASSSTRVTRSTLCLRERDEVNLIVDKFSGQSLARSGRRVVIVTIYLNRVEGRVRTVLMCLCRFRLV